MSDKDTLKEDSIKLEESEQTVPERQSALPSLEARTCSNCDGPLVGHFCGSCGQKDTNLLRPFWALMEDTLGDLFAFDSRFFRTLIPLFFRPGHITRVYNQGKRARFVPPFRQYLVISVVFFLMLGFSNLLIFESSPDGSFQLTVDNKIAIDPLTDADNKSLPEDDAIKSAGQTLETTADKLLANREENLKDSTESEKKFYDFAINAVKGARKIIDNPALLNKLFSDWVPKAMFLMLPVFALLFKIFYIRRKKYYIEHLVFSLHFHAFIFLLFTFMLLCYVYIPFSHDTLAYFFWYVPLYLFIAQWVVYGQGPIKTFFKSAFISLTYIILMSISLGIALGYGLSRV